MENLHNGKSEVLYTSMDQVYLLEFTTVSEDSNILSHINGSLLFLLCMYEISKILMVRAHIVKSPAFYFHTERSRNHQHL